ncbi:MAG TPA: DUF4372 domain-containing protein [Deltaproteobacteria bacterium]|nr:DUF4372 domain-containing protein [Deltaproteobacteria bacterium]
MPLMLLNKFIFFPVIDLSLVFRTGDVAVPHLFGLHHVFWQTRFFPAVRPPAPTLLRYCVRRYRGNHKLKSFHCLEQYLCMAFGQLTCRESLRDIEACLRAQGSKLYHMGVRSGVSRNTLSNANKVRDWRIHADFAQALIRIARPLLCQRGLGAGTGQHRVRPGFLNDRPVPVGLPAGAVSLNQIRHQVAHPAGLARKHPGLYPHLGRETARRECP